MRRERIWELDVFRGICIAGMLAVHFVYDLQYFAGLSIRVPDWFRILGDRGHLLFILLSGICVTLGHRPFQRGFLVFAAGILVSYVTLFADLVLGYTDLRIWFGILHLLGLSMMLYPLFRELSVFSLSSVAVFLILSGLYFDRLEVAVPWLFPLGLCSPAVFTGSDCFPVLPNTGWFLLGAAAGRILYPQKQSLLTFSCQQWPPVLFLRWLGQHSLVVYLLHQPVFLAVLFLLVIG